MKRILVNEAKLPLLEAISLIVESQESKSISQAKRLFMDKIGCDESEADNFVRNTLRNDLPSLRTKNGGKFILGATRLFLERELDDGESIVTLNKIIKFISSSDETNNFDRNLNGIGLDELEESLKSKMDDALTYKKQELGSATYETNDKYEIVKIDSFEEAKKYSQYTDWCITRQKSAFDQYTSCGINQFYFCLEKGFESIPRKVGNNAPLDEYGLSMIAVCVGEDGELNDCTSRWNHEHGGDDNVMDEKGLSEVVGRNFYETFKPNQNFKDKLDEFLDVYRSGKGLSTDYFSTSSFDDDTSTCIVSYNDSNKCNVMTYDGKKLYLSKWAYNIDDCDEFGFRKVSFGSLKGVNEIDCKNGGKLAFEFPMSVVWNANSQRRIAIVRKHNEDDNITHNVYDKVERKLISNIWFEYIYEPFNANDKFYDVCINNGYNVLNIDDGKLMFNGELVRKPERGFDGKRVIEIDANNGIKKMLADKEYNVYKDMTFDDISDCDIDGLHRILKLNGKYSLINKDWKMLDGWYDYISLAKNTGVYYVFSNGYDEKSLVMIIAPNDEALSPSSQTPFDPFQ